MTAHMPQPSTQLPLEIQERIVEYATASSKYHGKRHLRTLRQVSRSFCAAASGALFSTCTVFIRDSNNNNNPFADLDMLHHGSIAPYIRTLIIECRPPWDHFLTHPDINLQQWINLLSISLPRLVRLRRLEYQTMNDGTPDQENFSRHLANLLVQCLDVNPPPSLQEIDFQHHYPQIHDSDDDFLYPATTEYIPRPVMARLRHMQLSYTSSTSSLFEREPTSIFSLLRHAGHLISVEISGQMDGRRMTTKSCRSLVHPDAPLRSFALENVSVSAARLCGLRHFKQTLRHVSFRNVSLTAGTWEDVLCELRKLEELTVLEVEMCGYDPRAKTETNGEAGSSVPSSKIATSRHEDLWALQKCVAVMQRNRVLTADEAVPKVVDPFGRGVVC
ncbi:hypothetical protein AbraIFM66951_009798 [Aspergillus brasiliensis]|uniref:Uncharacterized protein n=1 Tax=Aspergillus brasiliensis TaxID=319629 RepID=A0A9W6DKC2_9EURO|nr:hypothetical protein AbraCBS73388_004715 [Aspergillus brasiliensis]GKZ46659.1 hypothetical protein AbraIFM66951_009798 [Aspergillus brasiliensis]